MTGSHATLLAALLVPTVALAAAGCGGSGAASSPGSAETATRGDAIPGPPRAWAEMGRDERRRHMVREVFPRMSAMFAEYDATEYADFSCATCHGPDAEARGFEMPNPGLYPLSPTGSEGQHRTVSDHPEMVRFMYNRVVPAMQALIAAPAYDEATHEGFTCYACHPHAEETEPVAAR